MPKGTAEQGRTYWQDEGTFPALLKSCEEEVIKYQLKSNHAKVKRGEASVGEWDEFSRWNWTWELLEGDHEATEIVVRTRPSIEIEGKSLAREAYEALSGQQFELGQDYDTDLVVGLKARLVLAHKPPRVDGDRTFYDTEVTEVLPALDEESRPLYDKPPF